MLGQSLAVHCVPINMAVVNDDLGFPLNKLLKTLVPEGGIADQPIQGHQGGGRNETAEHGIVTTVHRVLNGIAQHQKQHQIEWRELTNLSLAAQAQQDDQEQVNDRSAHQKLPPRQRHVPHRWLSSSSLQCWPCAALVPRPRQATSSIWAVGIT